MRRANLSGNASTTRAPTTSLQRGATSPAFASEFRRAAFCQFTATMIRMITSKAMMIVVVEMVTFAPPARRSFTSRARRVASCNSVPLSVATAASARAMSRPALRADFADFVAFQHITNDLPVGFLLADLLSYHPFQCVAIGDVMLLGLVTAGVRMATDSTILRLVLDIVILLEPRWP